MMKKIVRSSWLALVLLFMYYILNNKNRLDSNT